MSEFWLFSVYVSESVDFPAFGSIMVTVTNSVNKQDENTVEKEFTQH